MNTANTTICISSFFKLNMDNHKKKEFRCLVCQFEYNNYLGFPQTKISMRDFAPMRCFWEQINLLMIYGIGSFQQLFIPWET